MSGPILEIKDLLVVRNQRPTLDVPSLSFDEGRITSLIGPNGAGKTTLLLSIMRLVRFDRGEIRYRGALLRSGRGAHPFRRKMALIFQEPLLFNATVYDNIASGPRMRGMARGDVRAAVRASLELLGIEHLARRPASKLSGGEAQRVNIARSLAVRPDILLMDEPFSGLDVPSREALIEDLERIVRDTGITAILATHDRGEAIRLADEIMVMNDGKIVQTGRPGDITQNPANEFVASFMGTETILSGVVAVSRDGLMTIETGGKKIGAVGAVEAGKTVTFCVHPENIVLSVSTPDTSARNTFRARVTKSVSMGFFRKVYLDCGFVVVAYVTNRSADELSIHEGAELTASFKATSVRVIKTQ